MSETSRTILGFDFGMKSIGVAVGQEITGTAAPLAALKVVDGIPKPEQIDELIATWQPQALVVGLPLNMDGTSQHVTHGAKKFARRLQQRLNIPTHTCDERLTTVDAKARLFELGGYKKLDKAKVDSVSACLIVESWMSDQYS